MSRPGTAALQGHRRDRAAALGTGAAAVALVLLGADLPVRPPLTTASRAALVTAPAWAAALSRYHRGRTVVAVALLALVSGSWLALVSAGDHEVDVGNAVRMAVHLLTGVGGLGVLLWSRQHLRLEAVAGLWSVGALGAAVLDLAGSVNPWKYQLSVPVTILVLALAQRSRRSAAAVVALLALATTGVLNDSRSYSGFAVLTAVLVLWQALRGPGAAPRRRGPGSLLAALALLGGLVAGLYGVASSLLVSGALGGELQARSVAQVRDGGSLLAGGRPEWTATLQLVADSPAGFGLGVVPTTHDVLVAKAGLSTVGIAMDNGYVDHYMFGGQFELHSVLADAWARFGWVGAGWAALVGALLLVALAGSLAERRAVPLVVFLSMTAVWSLAFGPIYSDLSDVLLALGVSLSARTSTAAATATPDAVPRSAAHSGVRSRTQSWGPPRETTSLAYEGLVRTHRAVRRTPRWTAANSSRLRQL